MVRFRKPNLRSPDRVDVHSEKELAFQLWTKYLRPTDRPDHEGFDATAAIAGDTGMGKSELAVALSRAVSELSGVPFQLKRQVVYTREQLNEAIHTLPRYSCIVVDEAVNVLFSRDDQKNIGIIKTLEMCRSRNLAMFFCMPDFSAMDSKVRNSRIRYWIDIRKVGEGLEFIRLRRTAANPHMTDPWNNWAFPQIGNRYEAHPNFVGYIRWSRLPKEVRQEYIEHKDKTAFLSEEKEGEENRDSIAPFLVWLDNNGFGERYVGLKVRAAEYFGITPEAIQCRLRPYRRAKNELNRRNM